jgi:hypothetical protein
MGLEKIAQNVAQSFICQNYYIINTWGKSSTNMWATSVIFKRLPKVNNHLLGENSPNLITLILCYNKALFVKISTSSKGKK